MTTMPPRLPTWLLTQCLPSDVSEVIEGDLLEEYRRRESRAWYWRQVLGTIAASAFADLRSHKWLVFRAVVVGFMALQVTGYFLLSALLRVRLVEPLELLHKVTISAPYFFVVWTAVGVSSWVVARAYPARWTAALCGYLILLLAIVVAEVPWLLLLADNDLGYSAVMPFQFITGFVGLPLSLLAGGLLGAPRQARANVRRATL